MSTRGNNEKVPFSLLPPADLIARAIFFSAMLRKTHMGVKISYHSLPYG